jgi:hypothetical protein
MVIPFSGIGSTATLGVAAFGGEFDIKNLSETPGRAEVGED